MKKSNLGTPRIISEDMESAFQMLRSHSEEIIKAIPALNLNAITDHNTHEIIGYEPLGDPTSSRVETKTFKIMGQEIPISIAVSKFKDANNMVKEDKTLNYDPSKMIEIIETGKNLFALAKFFHEHVTTKVRGLMPEAVKISQFDSQSNKPLFGKPWLDYVAGNFGNTKDLKALSAMSHADLFLSGQFNLFLTQYEMIYDTLLLAMKEINTGEINDTQSIVSNEAFNPGVFVDTSRIVDQTEIHKVVDPIGQKISSINGTPNK